MIFTTVSKEVLEASTVIRVYRTRWQVELAFKRLKSLLDLNLLRCQKFCLVDHGFLNLTTLFKGLRLISSITICAREFST